MGWESIVGSIASFAPTIGAAIGGPIGGVAGMGIKALCSAFGVESDQPDAEEQVKKALTNMTPEQALKLKQADQQFAKDMKKLEVDVFKLEVDDKKSARKMYSKSGRWPQLVLAAMIVFGTFGAFWAVLAGRIPSTVDAMLVGAVIGALISEFKQITGFFFGSSESSQDKTSALADAINKK